MQWVPDPSGTVQRSVCGKGMVMRATTGTITQVERLSSDEDQGRQATCRFQVVLAVAGPDGGTTERAVGVRCREQWARTHLIVGRRVRFRHRSFAPDA